jgi:hypothetical protein
MARVCEAREKLRKEMVAVKRELGREEDELVFVGMADVAQFWWCAENSILKNRRMELDFFGSFKEDVWNYSLRLGYRKEEETPSPNRLLELRERISFEDIQRLLGGMSSPPKWEGSLEDLLREETFHSLLRGEIWATSVDPEAIKRAGKLVEKRAPVSKILPLLKGLPPTLMGRILEPYYRERYPTIRWNFDWKEYIVVGVPDGITDRFVYEFKTSDSPGFFLKWVWPVAVAQGDLYGHFFRRGEKRIQVLFRKSGETEVWQLGTDRENALGTLKRFREAEKGKKNPVPPREWKCRRCEFRWKCVLGRKVFNARGVQGLRIPL